MRLSAEMLYHQKLHSLGYIYIAQYGSTFNHCVALKGANFRQVSQNNGHYAVQGHSRSPILVPILSPYATSLVNNSNLPPILHHFRDIVDY